MKQWPQEQVGSDSVGKFLEKCWEKIIQLSKLNRKSLSSSSFLGICHSSLFSACSYVGVFANDFFAIIHYTLSCFLTALFV